MLVLAVFEAEDVGAGADGGQGDQVGAGGLLGGDEEVPFQS